MPKKIKRTKNSCQFCGDIIIRNDLDNWKYNKLKFCNKDCLSLHHATKRIKKKCRFCGEIIGRVELDTWHYNKLEFCDLKCLGRWNGERMKNNPNNPTRLSNIGRAKTPGEIEKRAIKMRGKNSHFWKGGKSFEKYTVDWTETLRISIRERDLYTCQVCGKKQGDIAHHIHHIDYNKKNCDPNNLITLCASCHGKTNSNRDKWTNYFKKLE